MHWQGLLVVALLSLVGGSAANQAAWMVTDPTYDSVNRTLKGKSIETIDGVYLPSLCAQICYKDERCQSFNFNYEKAECMINDATDEDPETTLAEDAGSVYYRRADYTVNTEVLGLCKSNPCKNHARCIESCGSGGERQYECICVGNWKGQICDETAEEPVWSPWSEGGKCTVTCGEGVKEMKRICTDPDGKGVRHDCYGPDVKFEPCNAGDCPSFSVWSVWSNCEHRRGTCRAGVSKRERTCLHEGTVDRDLRCTGPVEDLKPCQPLSCDVTVRLVSDGSAVSKVGHGHVEVFQRNAFRPVCSDGFDIKDAQVICRQLGFVEATGVSSMTASRDDFGLKQVDCEGTEESLTSCGYTTMGPSDACADGLAMVQCKVDGGWGKWGEWGTCSVTCGEGLQRRGRQCNHPEPENGGAQCQGEDFEERACTMDPCPVDGFWGDWLTWGQCSQICGGGLTIRRRVCTEPEHGGKACEGRATESKTCNVNECPKDGQWNPWQDWGDCSKECGTGTRLRSRTCLKGNDAGKPCEGESEEMEDCNTHECPVDGVWKDWGAWGDCSVVCGDAGVQLRTRVCFGPFHKGAECVGDTTEERACPDLKQCPVNGKWLDWSGWEECSKACGGGTQERTRECYGPFHDGEDCKGESIESQQCNTGPCPRDGFWEPWLKWGSCSVTCGIGTRERTRSCNGPYNGGAACTGIDKEQEPCDKGPCPINGEWADWDDTLHLWGACVDGKQTRTRDCSINRNGGVNTCTNNEDGREERNCVV